MRKILLLAATLAALPLTVIAQTNTAVTAYEAQRYSIDGERFDAHGLRHDMTGEYASGLQFDSTLRTSDIDGVALRQASIDVRYLWNGAVGPQLGYDYARLAGLSADRFTFGLAGAHRLDNATSITGALVSDLDAFGDDFAARIDAEREIAAGFTLYGGLNVERFDGVTGRGLELGSRYGIGKGAFIDGRANYERIQGDSRRSLSVGIGFAF